MLSKMRNGAQSLLIKFILFGLLMMAMLGLAFTDVQGLLRGGMGNATVAKVAGDKINAQEFSNIYERTVRQQNIPADEAVRSGLPLIVLNQEINARIYAHAAHDLGLIVDDKTAVRSLRADLITPIAQAAKISEKDALRRFLQSVGTSESAFVQSYKNQMASEKLIDTIGAPARAPAQLVADALKRRHEWRRGEYFELSAADLGQAPAAPTEDALKKHYESIASDFLLPEYRDFNVLLIDRAGLGISDKPTAAAIEKYYKDNIDHYALPEQRTVQQAIIKDEAAAKALRAAVDAGKTIETAAREAKASFTTGAFGETGLDVDLAKPVFAAKAGDVVGPVKSPFGWHVMKVTKIEKPRTRPFDEVKAEIERDLGDEITGEALYSRANEMDEAAAGGQSLAEIAKQNGLKLHSFTGVTSEGTGKDGKPVTSKLPAFAKIVETAYTLDQGSISQLTETSDGGFLLIETTGIVRAQEQPFDTVRGEVAESLRAKKLGEMFDAKTTEITERIGLGTSFDEIAKSLGKRVASTGLVQRATTPGEAGIERGVLPALFSLDKVGQTTAVSGDEKVTILRLAERKIEKPKDGKDDTAALQKTLDKAMRNDILEQYRNHLMREYKVSINEDALTRLYAQRNEADTGQN